MLSSATEGLCDALSVEPVPVLAASQGCPPKRGKTRLCAEWQHQGHCHRGSSCQFAHGVEQMQVGDSAPYLARNSHAAAGATSNASVSRLAPTVSGVVSGPVIAAKRDKSKDVNFH